jgi:hypothetical protein
MKKLIYSALLAFIGLTSHKSFAQTSRIPYYDNISFGDSFFKIAETDERSDYYVVDLSKLSSEFQKAFFISLTFAEPKIVRIDADNNNMAWFKANKVFTQTEIAQLFLSLNQRAISADSMTEAEKNEWLNRNGK